MNWLIETFQNGVNGILGDEMGLGKTMQTITFLGFLKLELHVGGPSLIICPLSVLSSWMTEFRRWCPKLRVIKMHSSDSQERDRIRKDLLSDLNSYDAVVTTYEMVKNKSLLQSLRRVYFRYLVVDEGHGGVQNTQSSILIHPKLF